MKCRIFGAMLLLAAAAGCHTEPKPTPAVPVSIEELAGEWKANKDAVAAKYKGRLLEVSGMVSLATNDTSMLLPMVRLSADGAEKRNRASVICLFLNKEAAKIDRLCEGQELTVRGQLIDAEGNEPTLLYCEATESGVSPALNASPQQLSEEYKTDKDKMMKKYDSRWVVVEGFVAAIERPKWKKFDTKNNVPLGEVEDEHCYRYLFKMEDKNAVPVGVVCCSYHNDALLKKYAAVAVGQKIKVRGRCDKVVWREKKRIELTQGVLLDD
jgi:hypothetical protein